MSGKRSRELLKRLTALKSFDIATGKRLSGHLRMADRELALRWVSFSLLNKLSNYGGDNIATLEDLLNITTEQVDLDHSIDIESLIDRFDNAMIQAYSLFGRHTFRKWEIDNDKRYPINRALFEAWSVPLGHYEKIDLSNHKNEIQLAFRKLCSEDAYFINAISAGTGDPRKVRYRFNKIDEIIMAAVL
jgi:hypothetical protein